MSNSRPSRTDLRAKPKKKKNGFFKKTFKVFLYIFLVFAIIGLGGLLYGYLKYGDMVINSYKNAQTKIEFLDEDIFKSKGKTIIYDDDGNVIKELSVADYYYVESDDIPKNVKYAAIAIEDERFLKHEGIDYKSLARAGVALLKNKGEITQGGSTITQQLIKNTLLTHEQTYSRKLEEIFIAIELEKVYSKEKILEFYLNNIYFGGPAYGIETASKYYFSKDISELTIAEGALLVAVTNNPSVYSPINNMDNALKRQQRVLKKMLEHDFITEKEYQEAVMQKIELKVSKRVVEKEDYATSFIISDATKKLMGYEGFEFKFHFENDAERKEYEAVYNEKFQEANQKIRSGGFKIYSSIDMNMQENAQNVVNKHLGQSSNAKDKESGLYKRQATNVVIENETGFIKSIIGGRTQDDVANTYNRAFLSHRQPGSTMKPLAAYTQAFENGLLPTSIVKDEPIKNGPSNWDGRYHGSMNVTEAVVKSWNTIPYRLLIQNGIDDAIEDLRNMNFSRIVDADRQAGLAIGGLTYGVSTLELAGGYSTLARNGSYIEPTGVKEIVYLTDEIIYKHAIGNQKQVFKTSAAYLMTTVLQSVSNAGYNNPKFDGKVEGFATATKTGSTNQYKDIWFAGYTPYYTSVVWVGEDTPTPLKEYAYDTPLDIWNETMNIIHKTKTPITEFKPPIDSVEKVYYNARTGDVSETAKSGYVLQWIPVDYIKELKEKKRLNAIESAKDKEQREKEAALRAEEQRKNNELKKKEQEEKARLEAERVAKEREDMDNWLKAQGSSLNQEESILSQTNQLLNNLSNYQVTNQSHYSQADVLIENVQTSIEKLLVNTNINSVTKKLNEEKTRIQNQKKMVEDNIRLEEERKKREEAERIQKEKEEAERLKQEQLEQQEQEQQNPVETSPSTEQVTPNTSNSPENSSSLLNEND